VPYRTAGIL